MRNIARTLADSDPGLLPILAKIWDVDVRNLPTSEIIDKLSKAMLEPDRAEKIWDMLDEDQIGALKAVLGSGGKMPANMFTRLFGEIRQMGAAQIEREKPHLNPNNSAEALFYRGLIAQAFEQAGPGARPMIYVPDDLAEVLPKNKTSYDNAETTPAQTDHAIEPIDDVQNVRQADTSIVDDMATLLAYLQLNGAIIEGETFVQADRESLLSHFLNRDETRLAFMVGLGITADLIEVETGKAATKRAEVRRWLAGTRAAQIRQLADSWRSSATFRDLWHVPGLHPEPTGWPYDPLVARTAVLNFLNEIVPEQDWWGLEDFIEEVKATEPDFQRPGGDYSSWYIRNDKGDYLEGFESWDAVEGALLEYYITGPMHWLGLVDLGEDAARMTAYGRAFAGVIPWPNPPEPEGKITVQDDAILLVPRRVTRIDRFQVARFTTWIAAGDPYTYRLDSQGIARAAQQGINTGHISAFITRALGDKPLPPKIAQLLENWKAGPTAQVTMERLIVLRTTAPETLNLLLETPALRRYLGAQLGPMAVVVRADQWEALRGALGEHGIEAELIGW
jgi:hypothetical protein